MLFLRWSPKFKFEVQCFLMNGVNLMKLRELVCAGCICVYSCGCGCFRSKRVESREQRISTRWCPWVEIFTKTKHYSARSGLVSWLQRNLHIKRGNFSVPEMHKADSFKKGRLRRWWSSHRPLSKRMLADWLAGHSVWAGLGLPTYAWLSGTGIHFPVHTNNFPNLCCI